MRILLVEPRFPIPPKSLNHKDFFPIGLLKIGSYLRDSGVAVRLVRGRPRRPEELAELRGFDPDEVWITSLFTYWAGFVTQSTRFYKDLFPQTKIVVGGIYASLMSGSEVKEYTGCDEVYQGVMPEAEEYLPAYDLLDRINGHEVDYQILHASRGCRRKCSFCGTWRIEPQFAPLSTIKDRVIRRKLVFYDNNFLMNPHVEQILQELAELKSRKALLWCESQSGFDGRILLERPSLAKLIRKAGFRYPRIAWDWKYEEFPRIQEQLRLLTEAGYPPREMYVFVLYNWDIPFEEMEKKRVKCWEWGVQIADCRYRPLDQLYDNYRPDHIDQASGDYYIHETAHWTDKLVKQFRRNVRQQNICVRHGFPFYSRAFEIKSLGADAHRRVREASTREDKARVMMELGADCWFPDGA
jgi:hypothetical protein